MVRERKAIEIGDLPELLRLAEEVRATREPRLLRHHGEDLALLVPASLAGKSRGRPKTPADYDAFRSAAGGWSDVDTDTLIEAIYADRQRGDRRPVKL
jgi:hypothetical protein